MVEGVVVRERRTPSERCPYCHDSLRQPVTRCPECQVGCHAECRALLGRCPTLGCKAAVGGLPLRASSDADARQALVQRIYLTAALHAAISVACFALAGLSTRLAARSPDAHDVKGVTFGLLVGAAILLALYALRAPLLHAAVARLLAETPLDMTLTIVDRYEGGRPEREVGRDASVPFAELYVPQSASGPARKLSVRLARLFVPGPAWLTSLPRHHAVPVRVWGAARPGPVVIESPGGRLFAASAWSVERHRGIT